MDTAASGRDACVLGPMIEGIDQAVSGYLTRTKLSEVV